MAMPDGRTPEERRAFDEGIRQASLDARLHNHEARLNAINGSVARHAAAAERQNVKLDHVIAQLERNEALDKQRVNQLRAANEKQISTRQFWLGVITIVVVLIASVLGATLGGIIH